MIGNQNINRLIDMNRHKITKITKKTNQATAVARANECQYVAALQEISIKPLTRNKKSIEKVREN